MLQEVLRGRAEAARGDLVAGEGLIRGWVNNDTGDIGEVAGALLLGWHEGDAGGGEGADGGALPGAEEEELVANDAAARRGAELIALLRIGRLGKEIARV